MFMIFMDPIDVVCVKRNMLYTNRAVKIPRNEYLKKHLAYKLIIPDIERRPQLAQQHLTKKFECN